MTSHVPCLQSALLRLTDTTAISSGMADLELCQGMILWGPCISIRGQSSYHKVMTSFDTCKACRWPWWPRAHHLGNAMRGCWGQLPFKLAERLRCSALYNWWALGSQKKLPCTSVDTSHVSQALLEMSNNTACTLSVSLTAPSDRFQETGCSHHLMQAGLPHVLAEGR